MEATHRKLRIFVGCTGEVRAEAEIVRAIANDLNKTVADSLGIWLEVVDWKSHVVGTAGRPQQVILDQLPVDTWDIFIGILWLRFGTPSGGINDKNGLQFNSGTEEEFALAYKSWSDTGKPRVIFYRCMRATPPNMIDLEQIQKINNFFSNFSATGNHPGLATQYDSIENFEKRVQNDLIRLLLDYSSQHRIKEQTKSIGKELEITSKIPSEQGFLGFFTPITNDERNKRKKAALLGETRLIRLLAYVGHSYIARVGNRFGDELIQSIEAGAHFQIQILNPWTETGLIIAIAEADQQIEGLDLSTNKVDLSKIDIISTIKDSTYYRYSLLQVLDEYKDLKKEFGDQVQLRLTTHNIPATILLTTSMGFFEPYISANLRQRLRKALHTFEVQYSNESYFYNNTSTYFDVLWRFGEPFQDFLKNEAEFQDRLLSTW